MESEVTHGRVYLRLSGGQDVNLNLPIAEARAVPNKIRETGQSDWVQVGSHFVRPHHISAVTVTELHDD